MFLSHLSIPLNLRQPFIYLSTLPYFLFTDNLSEEYIRKSFNPSPASDLSYRGQWNGAKRRGRDRGEEEDGARHEETGRDGVQGERGWVRRDGGKVGCKKRRGWMGLWTGRREIREKKDEWRRRGTDRRKREGRDGVKKKYGNGKK